MQVSKQNIVPCLTANMLRLNNIETCLTSAISSEMKRMNGMHTLVFFFYTTSNEMRPLINWVLRVVTKK